MKRSAPLRRRAALAPVSSKRRRERRTRQAVVIQVALRDGLSCYGLRVLPGHVCAGPLDAHEVIPRSAWPGGHLVASNVRLVCRKLHDIIGEDPSWAHRVGLHGFSWERPQ